MADSSWRCCVTREQVILAAVNLLLVYMLFEARQQLLLSAEKLRFLDSFRMVQQGAPQRHHGIPHGVLDGVPLRHRILHVDDTWPTTTTAGPTTPADLSQPPDCGKLAAGEEAEQRRVKVIQNTHYDLKRRQRTAGDFIELTKDCSTFIRTMGYRTAALSAEEREYPIAYGIRMHRKVAMVERLLRAIYYPQNVICIYIDKKSSQDVHQAMAGIAGCLSNVFLASHTDVYMYGSYTAVAGDLQCMGDALHTRVHWRYYLNLAGQEYPLKTNLEIVRMLKLLNGTNDIESYPLPKEFMHRVDFHHLFSRGAWSIDRMRPKSPFTFANVSLRKGCSYNTFSRAFIKWVREAAVPKRFIEWSKDTDSPDELVWASLNALPEAPGGYPMYVTQVAKTFLSREIVWQWGAGYCQGQLIRHICIFSFRDLGWLIQRWEFFANKFDPTYDHIILDCLDEDLRRRERENDPDHSLDWQRLRHLPHIQYRSSHGFEKEGRNRGV